MKKAGEMFQLSTKSEKVKFQTRKQILPHRRTRAVQSDTHCHRKVWRIGRPLTEKVKKNLILRSVTLNTFECE